MMKLIDSIKCTEILGISRKTLYRWIKEDKIPYYVIGSHYRFDPVEIEEWACSRNRK